MVIEEFYGNFCGRYFTVKRFSWLFDLFVILFKRSLILPYKPPISSDFIGYFTSRGAKSPRNKPVCVVICPSISYVEIK